jgi:hypothetical protein
LAHGVIGDIESGALTLPGGKPDGFRGYVPILVLLHPFPQHPVTLTALLDEVGRRGLFRAPSGGPAILPPQLVSADDLELLEPVLAAGGDGLTHHLVRRDVMPATRGFSIRRYLQQRLGSMPENAALRDLVRELTDLAGEHVEAEVRRRNQA